MSTYPTTDRLNTTTPANVPCPKFFLGLCSDEKCREDPYSYKCLIPVISVYSGIVVTLLITVTIIVCWVAKRKGKVSIRQPLPNIEDIVSHTPHIPHVPSIPTADVDVDDSSSDYSTERPVEMESNSQTPVPIPAVPKGGPPTPAAESPKYLESKLLGSASFRIADRCEGDNDYENVNDATKSRTMPNVLSSKPCPKKTTTSASSEFLEPKPLTSTSRGAVRTTPEVPALFGSVDSGKKSSKKYVNVDTIMSERSYNKRAANTMQNQGRKDTGVCRSVEDITAVNNKSDLRKNTSQSNRQMPARIGAKKYKLDPASRSCENLRAPVPAARNVHRAASSAARTATSGEHSQLGNSGRKESFDSTPNLDERVVPLPPPLDLDSVEVTMPGDYRRQDSGGPPKPHGSKKTIAHGYVNHNR